MGLRGLTVLIASGDDGIGNLIVRKNPKVGCSRAWPDWPASSAYVTAVGATQLSDTYLPACTATYVPERFTLDTLWLRTDTLVVPRRCMRLARTHTAPVYSQPLLRSLISPLHSLPPTLCPLSFHRQVRRVSATAGRAQVELPVHGGVGGGLLLGHRRRGTSLSLSRPSHAKPWRAILLALAPLLAPPLALFLEALSSPALTSLSP